MSSSVTLNDRLFPLAEGESVLDGLLRQGGEISHACRSGVCQSCLVKAVSGTPDARATKGLKSTLQASGYALACQWIPEGNVSIALPGAEAEAAPVRISALDRISAEVMRVRLAFVDEGRVFESRPGQYLNLINPAGVARSYSIASDYREDGCLELHIALLPQGEFTSWLFSDAREGDLLHARGAAGDCFYLAEGQQRDFPILLAGTGTGLAPLYGILHDALRQGHTGPITLLHGGSRPERMYLLDELKAVAETHPNVRYEALVLSDTGGDSRLRQGDLIQAALSGLDPGTVARQKAFLCGEPVFVQGLRKQIFLKGVRSGHIFCDAFITRSAAA